MMTSSFESPFYNKHCSATPIPLNKVSYCTSVSQQSNTLWTHLHSPPDDLFAFLSRPLNQSRSKLEGADALQIFRGNMIFVGALRDFD